MPEIKIDPINIQQLVDQAVEQNILSAVEHLGQDTAWLEKIERMINQAVVQRTLAGINSIDVKSVIHERVDEIMPELQQKLFDNFKTTGIVDQASSVQLTVMDDAVVVENELVTRDLRVVKTAQVQDLIVRGAINTDNRSWNELKSEIAKKTLEEISESWTNKLVQQVKDQIKEDGIDFTTVTIQGQPLVNGSALANTVTESNLKSLGSLRELQVTGELHVGSTFSVLNHRIGINTSQPEMALTLWDDEVVVSLGKHKANQAYVGTSRNQSLCLGVNRTPQIEIDTNGLTTVKKLRVGLHQIMFDSQVPGWSGTRGDLVLNNNPNADRVFGWVCLGSHKWQSLKSSE